VTAPLILVTGAARRVGAAITRCLHDAGCDVAIHFRRSESAAYALAAELNGRRPGSAQTFAADLDDDQTPPRLVAACVERCGRLDGLVNNASTYFATPLGEVGEDAWQRIVGSNLKAPLFLIQAAAPHLRRTGGAVVNIADIHAERPNRGYAVYCAAKAGLVGLTRALAVDLAPEVRVNAVAPGAILWPDDVELGEAERHGIVASTLLQRVGSPEDIARAVRFLLLDAPYVTGQVINVDGGRSVALP